MFPYVFQGNDGLLIYINGTQHTLTRSSHPNFDKVLKALREENWEVIPDLVDMSKAVVEYSQGLLEVRNGDVYWDGEPFHNAVTDRLLRLLEEDLPVTPLVNFLHKLKCNPSMRAVQELYGFLEKHGLPITPDGCIMAYKKVRGDYTDCHTGKVINKPASIMTVEEREALPVTVNGVTTDFYWDDESNAITVVWMPRNLVNDDATQTCSAGLHFCSLAYLPQFGTAPGNRVVLVKVNPADVVSIPTDCDQAKARTCRYEVVGEHLPEAGKVRDTTEAYGSVLYDPFKKEQDEDDDYEGDEEDDYEDDDYSDSDDSDLWTEDKTQSDSAAPREVVKTYDRNGVKQYRWADTGLYTSRAAYEEWKEYRDNFEEARNIVLARS